jgi:hypothetical protein
VEHIAKTEQDPDISEELRDLLADESRKFDLGQLDENLRRLAVAQKRVGVQAILTNSCRMATY